MSNTVVGLDIGTTKVTAVVGEMTDENHTRIIGVGSTPSRGMEKGMVVNVEEASECIQVAIDQAQRMADLAIGYVYIGIAGKHIQSFNSQGALSFPSEEQIRKDHVEQVLMEAQQVPVPDGKEIIHNIVRDYQVDEEKGIQDPVGMLGKELKANVHIVTGAVSAIHNLVQCAHNVDLDVADVILQPLASSQAVLTEDEKKMGVVLVDIGGGTTDIAVFCDGKLLHSGVIPVGGNHFTSDLTYFLRCPFEEGERLKIRYGSLLSELVDKNLSLNVETVGKDSKREVEVDSLVEVLQPRGEELVGLAIREIQEVVQDFSKFNAGIVLTGGGSQIRGMDKMFHQATELPVRIGRTRNVSGLVEKVSSPQFATAVGLIYYGYKNHELIMRSSMNESWWDRMVLKVREWFS